MYCYQLDSPTNDRLETAVNGLGAQNDELIVSIDAKHINGAKISGVSVVTDDHVLLGVENNYSREYHGNLVFLLGFLESNNSL